MALYNRKEKIVLFCKQCGEVFYVLPSRKTRRKFCSCKCFYIYQRGRKKIGNYKANSGSFKKNIVPWIKGRKMSLESREKQRIAKLNNPVRYWLGKRRNNLRKPARDKSKWILYRKQIMERVEYKDWRRKIFKRDNYVCQNCGVKNGDGKTIRLEAHHIQRAKDNLNLIFDIDNGVTLCYECHIWLDKIKF